VKRPGENMETLLHRCNSFLPFDSRRSSAASDGALRPNRQLLLLYILVFGRHGTCGHRGWARERLIRPHSHGRRRVSGHLLTPNGQLLYYITRTPTRTCRCSARVASYRGVDDGPVVLCGSRTGARFPAVKAVGLCSHRYDLILETLTGGGGAAVGQKIDHILIPHNMIHNMLNTIKFKLY
jgi:hypothetical protein